MAGKFSKKETDRIFGSKERRRRDLAKLPFEKKMEILERLRKTAAEIKSVVK